MHTYRTLLRSWLLAAMAASVLDVAAVRATPEPILTTLPDGSTMTIRLHGDERLHYATTTDGYLLLRGDDSFYRYATLADDGTPVAGALRATDVDARSAADRQALAALDRDAVLEAQLALLRQQCAASPLLPAPSLVASTTELDNHRKAMSPTTPSTGKPNLLVILVEYADTKFTNSEETFDRMMNEAGFSEQNYTGSVRDYFIDSSNGAYEPTFDVAGPVTLSQNSSYYAGSSGYERAQELLREACELVDEEVDFSLYDIDGDKIVDNVYIFFAGYGYADTGDNTRIWPHSSRASGLVYFDGVRLGNYTCSNELRAGTKQLAGIGTFCHEFSHALGLPDLYDTQYQHTNTPGEWSIMDVGSYNNYSRTPPLHSAYERWVLGWIAPNELAANEPTDVKLRPSTSADGYADVQLVRTAKSNEFFLMENRQKQGWDKYIPGHGMLLWHINFTYSLWAQNIANYSASKPGIDIVEATGLTAHSQTAAAAFPGTRAVTEWSVKAWDGSSVGFDIADIYESAAGNVYFTANGGNPQLVLEPILAEPAVDANSVAFSWSAVEGIEYYTLAILDPEGNTVAKTLTDATSYSTTLDEGVDYTARLSWTVATAESHYSQRKFTTGYLPISAHRVEALDPTEVDYATATANWLPLHFATDYVVEVALCEETTGAEFTEDFTDGQLHNDGWTCTAPFVSSYYGKAPRAVCLKEVGVYLATASWERPIDQAVFMACAQGTTSMVDLIIEAADEEGNWSELLRMRPAVYSKRASEGIVTLDHATLGDNVWALRFSIAAATNWVILDDFQITYADGYSYEEAGIGPFDAGGATTLTIPGLQPATLYAYRVHAFDAAGLASVPSQWVVFTTAEQPADPSAITDVAADADAAGPWFTTTGLRLDGRPTAPGLYIHNHRVVAIP